MTVLIIYGVIIIILITIIYLNGLRIKKKYNTVTKTGTVNQESYQRYAKFYDNIVPQDPQFNDKLNKIYTLIEINQKRDIKKIAEKSGCSYDECILKIKYLKNKRQINTYHVDHKNGKLLPCSLEDLKLIEKYKPYIYYNHLSISEIAERLPGVTIQNLLKIKEEVYQEILSLYKKDLLNGIKINEIDKKIIYYAVEKHKKEFDFITIRCENCGALNDVNRGSKTRCEYCDTIITDKTITNKKN